MLLGLEDGLGFAGSKLSHFSRWLKAANVRVTLPVSLDVPEYGKPSALHIEESVSWTFVQSKVALWAICANASVRGMGIQRRKKVSAGKLGLVRLYP